MSVVGSLIFCNDCGNLIDKAEGDENTLQCKLCYRSYPMSHYANLKVVTQTPEDAFMSTLKMKRSVVKTSIKEGDLDEGQVIKEKCPKCGNEDMQYQVLQLRSADEGATVFYTCTGCGYRFRTNN